jgi:hypothetical protein
MRDKTSVVAQRSAAAAQKGGNYVLSNGGIRHWGVHDGPDNWVGVSIPRVKYDNCKGARDVEWCRITNERN